MTTITTSDVRNFFHSIKQTLVDFKNTYCPDGQQCNDIATVSSLVFVIWFMYVAMEPLFTY
jgi:hypothetical protein